MKKLQRKKLFAALSLLVFLCTSIFIHNDKVRAYASLEEISCILGADVINDSLIPLYDCNNKIVAKFYQLSPIGYVIIDTKTEGIVEACLEENNKYITNSNKFYYYAGPLTYYETDSQDSKYVTNCKDLSIVEKQKVTFKSKTENIEDIFKKYINFGKKDATNSAICLPYVTAAYDTNTSNICGATAAAILIEYYYRHIDPSIVLYSSVVTTDGVALTNLMHSYIKGSANVLDVKYGLNNYFNSILINRNADYISIFNIITNPFNKIESCIRSGKPVIVGLSNHPTYNNHWVVGTGVQRNVNMVTVNDGWGNRGVLIYKSYIDCCVYIN